MPKKNQDLAFKIASTPVVENLEATLVAIRHLLDLAEGNPEATHEALVAWIAAVSALHGLTGEDPNKIQKKVEVVLADYRNRPLRSKKRSR